jgi:hypothetical protein
MAGKNYYGCGSQKLSIGRGEKELESDSDSGSDDDICSDSHIDSCSDSDRDSGSDYDSDTGSNSDSDYDSDDESESNINYKYYAQFIMGVSANPIAREATKHLCEEAATVIIENDFYNAPTGPYAQQLEQKTLTNNCGTYIHWGSDLRIIQKVGCTFTFSQPSRNQSGAEANPPRRAIPAHC